MEYYGVNPQGYHGINFGSFVPKPSFKVRQLAASSARRDATISTTANREDYGYIRQQQQHRDTRRLRGCSLPEIKVKRLLKEPKKKHSGAHTFGGASSEKMRFPVIVPTADTTNPNYDPTPRRGPQWMGGNEHDRERRVVRNEEPWWKWSKRHHDDDKQTGRNHSHKQRLPQIENLSAQHCSKEKAKHIQHNLRQKLPPLLGYRDDNGNLTFSEAENDVNMRALGNKSSRNVFMNRRYYYSYSRDGIRPYRPEAKVSNAYLYDLSNLQPSNPDYAAHQEAMISSMHNELQAVTGVLPLQGGSTLGAKVKQSLNRSHERNAKKWKRQPVVINIDSSYADSELEEEEKEEGGATTAPVTKHPKTLNQNHLKALAILQELINILNSAEFVPGSEYSGSNEASSVSEVPILSQINLGDFFQKPESVIKQYDRFKNITRSVHHPPNDDTSAEQVKLEHKEKHKNSHLEEKDRFGLTQLMAVHRLQTGSNEDLSSMDLINAAAKLTTRAYDSQNIDKIKTSNESFKSRSNKRDESILGDNNQHPELAQLLAVQQFQALNGNLSSAEVPDESKNVPNFTDSDEIGVSHHSFTQKSLSEKCDIQAQLVCVNLNDQFLQFSNGRPKKQFLKRHLSNQKSVHNVSKLLLIEPAEKQQNPRPDLVISGERLKHLYNLGLLNGDEELSQLAIRAEECMTVSREQLTRFQEICDQAGVAISDSTIPHPGEMSALENITDDSDFPGIEVNMDDHSGINCTDASDHGEIKGLLVEADTEQEDGGVDGRHQDQLGNTALKFSRDLSWDLESEFARVQAMDLQQRLQMEQLKKERKVLDSVKRDLQRFQETLHGGSGSESGERPMRQRESLLPPPPPPRKKNKSRASKKNEQQRKIEDALMSSDLSASEVEGLGMENIELGESEMEDFGSTSSEQHLDEFGDQLLDNQLDSSSIIAVDDESAREGDQIDDQGDFIEHSETVTDRYPAIPDVIEEESDGYLSDSDIDENTHSDDESQQSQTSLASKKLLPKSVLEEENQPEVEFDNNAESEDVSTKAMYDSVISDLTNSESTHEQKEQEHRTSTSQRTNTRGGGRPVSKLVNMDSWSHSVDAGGVGSTRSSDSTRGMRGSALRSQRGKRTSSSESKGASIGEDTGLSVSRPQTVQQIDVGSRTSSGQRSRLPTRERSRKSSRAQMTVADPTQVLVHRKSELAKQKLIEAQRKEAQLEQERERQRQEKLIRQAEFEDRMSAAFKSEEDEIRRKRKLKAEARRKAEELEEQRQALVQRMKREEAQREAEEKARHSAMLEGLRQEAERRHLQVMHEKGVIEDYQDCISAFNEWEYAYIDYYLGDSYSQEARKIDQSMKLKQEQLLHQKMMEAFEYKRKELLEKLKAAQKELMMELELEKGELDHFMKISRAFVFTYFKRVPDQAFMIPQELLV